MLTTAAIVLAVLLLFAVAVLWRLYNDGMRRADAAARQVAAERAKADQQQLALRRYEVAFASISGRGELGEQVLVETARALGLRENLHFTLQTDVAGGGAAKPDMVLRVGGDRTVPVDAKASMAIWAEAVETDDPAERLDALRAHVRQIRSRAAELAGKGYQRWADAIYGTIMFVPSDAAVVAALDTDPELLRWLIDRRVFLCGPTGFGVLASAALFAASDRTLEADVEQVRSRRGGRPPGGGRRGGGPEPVEHAPPAVPVGPPAGAGGTGDVPGDGGPADRRGRAARRRSRRCGRGTNWQPAETGRLPGAGLREARSATGSARVPG